MVLRAVGLPQVPVFLIRGPPWVPPPACGTLRVCRVAFQNGACVADSAAPPGVWVQSGWWLARPPQDGAGARGGSVPHFWKPIHLVLGPLSFPAHLNTTAATRLVFSSWSRGRRLPASFVLTHTERPLMATEFYMLTLHPDSLLIIFEICYLYSLFSRISQVYYHLIYRWS